LRRKRKTIRESLKIKHNPTLREADKHLDNGADLED
jgi:hypothetical protein